ncbi:hypothetical protein V6N13_024002 [Hibiscus sabdariffa]
MKSVELETLLDQTQVIVRVNFGFLKEHAPLTLVDPTQGRCSSLEMLWISECVALSKIGDRLSTATYLEELAINSCPNLTSIANLEVFSHLQRLKVASCTKLEIFPLGAPLSCPKELKLLYCPNLKQIPSIGELSSLTELEFIEIGEELSCCSQRDLPDLVSVPEGLERLHSFYGLTALVALTAWEN